MQIDNRGALDDVISGMKQAAKHDMWLRDGSELIATRPGSTVGVVADLPYDIPIEDCKLDFEGLAKALSTLDGDEIELTVEDDGATITLSDGDRNIAVRVRDYREGPITDPSSVDSSIADTVLDVPYGDISSEVEAAVKITDEETIVFDADGDTLHLSCESSTRSYDTDIDLSTNVTPTSSLYDTNLLKAITDLVSEADRVAFGEDAPLIAEGSIDDIDFTVLLAPKIEE